MPRTSAIDPSVLQPGTPVAKEDLRLQLDQARQELDGLFADIAVLRSHLNGFRIWVGTVEEYNTLDNSTNLPEKMLMVVVDTSENLKMMESEMTSELNAETADASQHVRYSLVVRHPKASTL
jgi:hypothetical protein